MSQAETILEIKDLCVEFQTVEGTVHAVDHLNYTLHKGRKAGHRRGERKRQERIFSRYDAADPEPARTDYRRRDSLSWKGSGESIGERNAEDSWKRDFHDFPGTHDFLKSDYQMRKADRGIPAASPWHEEKRGHGRGSADDAGGGHCEPGGPGP